MATLYAVSNLKLGKDAKGEKIRFAAGEEVSGLTKEQVKELMSLGAVSTRNPLADDSEAVAAGLAAQEELQAAQERIAELEAALASKEAPSPAEPPKA